MKKSGKMSGNVFTTKENGSSEKYTVKEKKSTRTMQISDNCSESYVHTTRVAYSESGRRIGVIESGRTGNSYVLKTES